MQSTNLLDELERVPLKEEHKHYNIADVVRRSERIRSNLFGIEIAAGVEESFSTLFDRRNIPDDLIKAYEKSMPRVAEDQSLYEHYNELLERGPDSIDGFINPIKGKLFELRLPQHLQEEFPNYTFSIAPNPTQPVWDISAISPDGSEVLIQAKMGGAQYAGDVIDRMQADPDVLFATSSEIRTAILDNHPELKNQLLDVDLSNYEFTQDATEDLHTLADNMGIDVPDSIGDFLPYVNEIVLGIKLIYDIVITERDFRSIRLGDRGRVHAMKALVLLSRFGITNVVVKAFGAAGAPLGSFFPGLGNIITILGAAAFGACFSVKLNRYLKPHMLEVAMKIMGINEDDMFYFRNKKTVDSIGESLAQSAASLT